MKQAIPAILIILAAGCAEPSDTMPANDALSNAGVAMDIDTIGAENMEAPDNLAASSPDTDMAEPGPDDARSVVTGYFAALEAKRYDRAYALWEPGAAGMGVRAFAESFAKYSSYKAEIGVPGRVDSGAGQRYVTVPVRITATTAEDGEQTTMLGAVTLHRVADIDGASAAQRHWRIRDTALTPRPVPAAGPQADYRCDGDGGFSVVFDTEADRATIERPGEAPVVLAGQRPASGIWYAGEGWELRGKGEAATLVRPGAPPVECSAAPVTESDVVDDSGGAGDGAEGDQAR